MRSLALTAKTLANEGLEQQFADALLARYPSNTTSGQNTSDWVSEFASKMEAMAAVHPDVIDVQVLAAEALMNISPWKLWDLHSRQPSPAPARTHDAMELLKRAEKLKENHPGMCHYKIH